MVYYKLHESGFLCKYCLLYFISNSLLNSWLLRAFSEKGISPVDAFYFLSACFFTSSKTLNSDYQIQFNELRVGVLLVCDYPMPCAYRYPAEVQSLLCLAVSPAKPRVSQNQGLIVIPQYARVLVHGWYLIYGPIDKPTNKYGL